MGVLSAAATAVASFQVTEALKIMAGREQDILSGLLVFDVWRNDFHIAPLERDPGCICSKLNESR